MSDPTTVPAATGLSVGTSASDTTNAATEALAALVASLNENINKLNTTVNSLSENVNKVNNTTTDSNTSSDDHGFSTAVSGAADPYDSMRRLQALAELTVSNAVTNADLITKQAIAHRDVAINHTWNIDAAPNVALNTALPPNLQSMIDLLASAVAGKLTAKAAA